tara:strand:- start:557 stop:1516 length:960 start_codon:yes stop_codon:yes gene_type:complete
MKLKIGVLGCSSIARKSLIPAIIESDNFELYGLGSRTENKAKSWADEFGGNGYSYQGLLDSEVDVIYVSLPVGLHYEWGKRVLESGKHLLMEKLFTETYTQAKELFDIAKKSNLICAEALMYEYHPVQSQLNEIISSLGNIKVIDAHLGCPHFHDNDIRYSKELGGGAITDYLVYPLSFVFRMLGKNFKDFNSVLFFNEINKVDERGYIQIQYEDAIANLSYGFGHAYRNEISVWTDHSIIKASRIFSRPWDCDEPIEVYRNGECKKYETQKSNHFLTMINNFYSNVMDNNTDYSSGTLSRLDFIDNLRKKSESNSSSV